jgi:hypothetical protein
VELATLPRDGAKDGFARSRHAGVIITDDVRVWLLFPDSQLSISHGFRAYGWSWSYCIAIRFNKLNIHVSQVKLFLEKE